MVRPAFLPPSGASLCPARSAPPRTLPRGFFMGRLAVSERLFRTAACAPPHMGSGSIDLAGVFRALVTSGYQGRSPSNCSRRVSSVNRLRGFWASGGTCGRTVAILPNMRWHTRAPSSRRRARPTNRRNAAVYLGLVVRRNANARGPGPQPKGRDNPNRTTPFDVGSGGGTRRYDLASRARSLATRSWPIGCEDLALQAQGNRAAIVPPNTRQSAQAT